MASTTIVFGVLLMLLGVGGYLATDAPTSLIPTYFGVILLVLGFLARAEHMRKHAMHAAAAVGLIGLAGALFSLLRTPIALRPALAVYSQVAMVILTAVFVFLCVKSFRDARRARNA
jgi:hypothetical protein